MSISNIAFLEYQVDVINKKYCANRGCRNRIYCIGNLEKKTNSAL